MKLRGCVKYEVSWDDVFVEIFDVLKLFIEGVFYLVIFRWNIDRFYFIG